MADTIDASRFTGRAPLTSHGFAFDPSPASFGELREANALLGNTGALRARMAEDGYLLLRGHLDPDLVRAARNELVEKLATVGLIDTSRPLPASIYSGDNSQLARIDRRAYAKSLRTGPALREVVHRGRIVEFFEGFLGGEVRPLDFIWVRNVRVGGATGCHIDWVYMGRGTRNLYTAW